MALSLYLQRTILNTKHIFLWTMTQTKVPTDISVKLNLLSSQAAWPILWPHGLEARSSWTCFFDFYSEVLHLHCSPNNRKYQSLNSKRRSCLTKSQLRCHLLGRPCLPRLGRWWRWNRTENRNATDLFTWFLLMQRSKELRRCCTRWQILTRIQDLIYF